MGEAFAGLIDPAGTPSLFSDGGSSRRSARRVMAAWAAWKYPDQPFRHEPGQVLRAYIGGQRYRYQRQEGGMGAFGFSMDSLRVDADPAGPSHILLFQCLPGDQKDDGFRRYRYWLYRYAASSTDGPLCWGGWTDLPGSRHIETVRQALRGRGLLLVEEDLTV